MGFVVTVASRRGGGVVAAYPLGPVFRPGMGFSCGGYFVNGTGFCSYAPGTCSFLHEKDAESFARRLVFLLERSTEFDPASIRVAEASRANPPPSDKLEDDVPATPLWRHLRRSAETGA